MIVKCLRLMTSNHCSPRKEGTGERVGEKDYLQSWTWRSIPWENDVHRKEKNEAETRNLQVKKTGKFRETNSGKTPYTCANVYSLDQKKHDLHGLPGKLEPPTALTPKPTGGCFFLSSQGNEVRDTLRKRPRWGDPLPLHLLVPFSSCWDLHGSVCSYGPAPVHFSTASRPLTRFQSSSSALSRDLLKHFLIPGLNPQDLLLLHPPWDRKTQGPV